MKLQNKDDALKIWEKNKYFDWNNFHYIDSDEGLKIESIQEFNSNECKTCLIIDELCELYYRHHADNSEIQNDMLIEKILVNEINVYGLMRLRESMGFINLQLDGTGDDNRYVEGIYDIIHYLYSSDYTNEEIELLRKFDLNINNVRTDCAKWCKTCGARKPNIYK